MCCPSNQSTYMRKPGLRTTGTMLPSVWGAETSTVYRTRGGVLGAIIWRVLYLQELHNLYSSPNSN
jgi:hypothetical protein